MAAEELVECPACAAMWPPTMRFCGECGTAMRPVVAPEPELRQLTMLFCDMVGSTELSTRIDAEALADVMRDYYVLCDRIITEVGGYIVKFHGDGVLACFGAPVALDDAALRGVQAACALVAATEQLRSPTGESLMARAGVHTGLVVAGATGVGTGHKSLDVLGEAANLASRLQAAASPGAVLISADTAALVPPHVELVDGADLQLKGINRLVRAYRVEGIGTPIDDLHRRARSGEAALVAREAELAILLGLCHLSAQGAPQFVVLVGEPGIGKSRLLRELRDSPARPPGRLVVLRGLQDRATTPFAPLLDLVARHGSELPAVLEADLAELLRPDRQTGDLDTPDRRRRRSIDAVCDGLLGLADQELLIIMLDDLQWFDPSTLELLGVLRERAVDSRLAVLASARPEWVSPWPAVGDLTILPLPRLDPAAIRRMLADLQIDDEVLIEAVIDRSEGVPLFLEEFVRQRRDGSAADSSEVPHSVADLLRARLERLGPDLEFARECSVFGRDVDVAVAAYAFGSDVDTTRDRLRRLADANIVRERLRGRVFSFQHVLLRDAAYESLKRTQRVRLHRSAAESIAAQGKAFSAQHAEQLARHWTLAGARSEAFRAWLKAGRLAGDRTALKEARAHFTEARHILMMDPPSEERDRNEVRLILDEGPVAYRLLGGGHEEVSALYERADELCVGEADPMHRARVMLGLYSFWVAQPDFHRAQHTLPRLLELADELPFIRPAAYFFAGSTNHMQGRFDEARDFLLQAIELVEGVVGDSVVDPLRVHSYGLLADITARDDLDAAMSWFDLGFAALEGTQTSSFERAWLELTMATALALRDDVVQAGAHAGVAADLGAQYALAQINVQADCLMAWIDAVMLGGDEPIERMRQAIDRFDTCGSRSELSMHLMLLARMLRERGRFDEAEAVLDRADRYIDETGERLHVDAVMVERSALLASR